MGDDVVDPLETGMDDVLQLGEVSLAASIHAVVGLDVRLSGRRPSHLHGGHPQRGQLVRTVTGDCQERVTLRFVDRERPAGLDDHPVDHIATHPSVWQSLAGSRSPLDWLALSSHRLRSAIPTPPFDILRPRPRGGFLGSRRRGRPADAATIARIIAPAGEPRRGRRPGFQPRGTLYPAPWAQAPQRLPADVRRLAQRPTPLLRLRQPAHEVVGPGTDVVGCRGCRRRIRSADPPGWHPFRRGRPPRCDIAGETASPDAGILALAARRAQGARGAPARTQAEAMPRS